jgi:peptide/nickel transport system permease protein
MRLALIPTQLVFVLVLLYVSIDLPVALSTNPSLTAVDFFQGFGQMVVNIFTGNWGIVLNPYGPNPYALPTSQLYADFLPNSIQLALFALPIAALIAYPMSLLLGWTRRPVVDVPARVGTLAGALVPAFVVGTLVLYAFFFAFFHTFHDIDSNGLIPTPTWFNTYYGSIPSWVLYGAITRPTGIPLIDGVIHQAWAFEAITLTKTLIQASIIALAYVAIFLRHARTLVASASQEPHITAARSRGISERTLLWYHTGRRVMPTLLLVFALTVPGYLATQFVVEGVFNDPGVGFLTLIALTQGGVGDLPMLEGLIFVLAAFVLSLVFVADLVANRLDPRGATTR